MRRFTLLLALLSLVLGSAFALAEFPKPNQYPLSWELKFTHGLPRRIVVDTKAYWYLPYTVTNKTDKEQLFLPDFEMVTENGVSTRSDNNIPHNVFLAAKKETGANLLEQPIKIGGQILLGEDQARESVAIWREPNPEMGAFSIFLTGLSGEAVMVKKEGNDFKTLTNLEGLSAEERAKILILRKTLQLNYLIRGDEVYPGEDDVNENPEAWVMR